MASYTQQKKAAFAHLRVSVEDAARFENGQFTLFDFLEHAFSFSPKRRQLAAQVLDSLRQAPKRFKDLLAETKAPKSGLHFVLTALENSGLIEKNKDGAFTLSSRFGDALHHYALFWGAWVQPTSD